MAEKMILTSETDIYAYFEIIDRAEIDNILDVGMFLKRIGGVSRQVKEKEIPFDKKLIGVDFFPEIASPIWNTIYDSVYKPQEIFLTENEQKYEMAVVMQLKEVADKVLKEAGRIQMWEWLSNHVSYILTDWKIEEVRKMIKVHTEREIKVDEKSYWFLSI